MRGANGYRCDGSCEQGRLRPALIDAGQRHEAGGARRVQGRQIRLGLRAHGGEEVVDLALRMPSDHARRPTGPDEAARRLPRGFIVLNHSGCPCSAMQARYAESDQLLSRTAYVLAAIVLHSRMDSSRPANGDWTAP